VPAKSIWWQKQACTCSIQQVGDDFEAVTLVYEELLPLSAIVHLLSVFGHQRIEKSIVLLSSCSPCSPNGPSSKTQHKQHNTSQPRMYCVHSACTHTSLLLTTIDYSLQDMVSICRQGVDSDAVCKARSCHQAWPFLL